MFIVQENWFSVYPGAAAGVLVLEGVHNPEGHPQLDEQKRMLENDLRSAYAGVDRSILAQHPVLVAYERYYKGYMKTYHVRLQLESILFKGWSIPSGAALVEAMFMAEIKNLLLTAGHDLDELALPVTLAVADGQETYTLMRGQQQTLKRGDMFMQDQAGIISSILYGPDQRSRINEHTRRVMFTVYAPPGIEPQALTDHLADIENNVRVIAPQARQVFSQVFTAGSDSPGNSSQYFV